MVRSPERPHRGQCTPQASAPEKAQRQSPEKQRENLTCVSFGVRGLLGSFIAHDLVQHGEHHRDMEGPCSLH